MTHGDAGGRGGEHLTCIRGDEGGDGNIEGVFFILLFLIYHSINFSFYYDKFISYFSLQHVLTKPQLVAQKHDAVSASFVAVSGSPFAYFVAFCILESSIKNWKIKRIE